MATPVVEQDLDAATFTVTTQFAAAPERLWQLWADPRQLERWWGPPTYPATVTDHDLRPGGSVKYFMTSPEGEQFGGWWRVIAVDEPRRLEVEDGFSGPDGNPNLDLPTTNLVVTFEGRDDGSALMRMHSTYASREALEQVLSMGAEEGMVSALGQIDGVLAG